MTGRIDLPEDWRDRLADYTDKLTQRQVAVYFGVSEAVVKRWIRTDADFARLFQPEPPITIPEQSSTLDVIDDLVYVTDVPRGGTTGREQVTHFDTRSLNRFLRKLNNELMEAKRRNMQLVRRINGERLKPSRTVHATLNASGYE